MQPAAQAFGIPFRHFPISSETRRAVEDEQLALLAGIQPAFIGAKPYHAAYGRGVKIIGAASHYVTAELDAGPIIEQDIARVNHKDTVEELIRKGKDVEKLVLARAITAHLRREVLIHGNKTIIFD